MIGSTVVATSAEESLARLRLFELYGRERRLIWIQANGRSMLPTITAGSWIQVEFGASPRTRGEIAVFTRGTEIIAHRVITLDGDSLLAKADAWPWFDPMLARDDVLGIVRAHRRRHGTRVRRLGCTGPSARIAAAVSETVGRAAGRLLARRVT